jgi:hypothetical protein
MWKDVQTNGETDTTKLKVTFRNFATRLKIICAQKPTGSFSLPTPMENFFKCFRKYQSKRNVGLLVLSAVPKNLNLTFWPLSFTFNSNNHQPDTTVFQLIILTFVYSSTCFGRFPAHHQELNDCSGSLCVYLRILVTVVLCSWLGRPAQPRTHHDYHHDTKVKPEAATAVIELLMIGGRTPETC